jgi:thiamine-phosphate pyrophosphorylase
MAPNRKNSFFRVLDAAANRAAEGLRVAEDIARMHLNDRHLSSLLKKIRHDLATQVEQMDVSLRHIARDSVGDVGRTISTAAEYQRGKDEQMQDGGSFDAITVANLKRAQQAFRTLEEFAKTDHPSTAAAIEQLRYKSYTIEKTLRIALSSSAEFDSPSLYVLVDGCDWANTFDSETDRLPAAKVEATRFAKTAQALVDAKVDFIQLRDKALTDRQLVAAGRVIAERVKDSKTKFIMNDRADIAVAVGADGIHVGQEELSVANVRAVVGPEKLIGVSTHSLEQAQAAAIDGANYIGVGPVFPSKTKAFDSHVGLDLIREVCGTVSLPAFAIGGINLENASQVATAGCGRVAVTAVLGDQPIEKYDAIAKQLLEALAADQ